MSRSRVKNPIQPGDGDPRHGKVSSYTNHECRCAKCRAAWADYLRAVRAARAIRILRRPELAPHGVYTTYLNWGCRCGPCTDAHTTKRWHEREEGAA